MSFVDRRTARTRLAHAASRLRRRITLQQPSDASDGGGGYTRSWTDVATVWGEIEPLGGAERIEAGRAQGIVSHRLIIRYRAGLTTAMRAVDDERSFNIRAVINLYEMDRLLELLCEEGVAT